MRKSDIHLSVELDSNNIPDRIFWNATDGPNKEAEETKAFALALWDEKNQTTMKIDLWSKDMPIDEMKLFCLEAIGGMSETLLSATSDEFMYSEIKGLCGRLMEHLHAEMKKQGK